MKYELEERVEKFGENTIDFAKSIKLTSITKNIIEQLIAAATSVGANYFEANGASSKKDFLNKIYICKKEVIESQHWFRMIIEAVETNNQTALKLWQEAKELGMIFSKIISNIKNKP